MGLRGGRVFLFMSSQYYQHHIGAMDDETLHEVQVYLRFYASAPGVWQWWRATRGAFGPAFRHKIDDLIDESKRSSGNDD